MPTIIKRVGSILQNRKNVSFEELEKILLYFGYTKSQRGRGSSHYTFRKKGMTPITVPKKRPHVNEHYVGNIIKLLELEDWHEKH
jgi:predicted RNA binding protein YcfA (HicA-like mRNA interferase family)